MYHIIREYWIKIDERNFTVMRKTGVSENGEPVFGNFGYWGTFANALEHIRKDIIRRKLKSGTGELPDAIKTIREESAEIKEIFQKLTMEM